MSLRSIYVHPIFISKFNGSSFQIGIVINDVLTEKKFICLRHERMLLDLIQCGNFKEAKIN